MAAPGRTGGTGTAGGADATGGAGAAGGADATGRTGTAGGAGAPRASGGAARAAVPRRRASWGVRRSALLLGGSGLAILGVLTLVVVWVGLVSASLRAGLDDGGACVEAATAGTDGAEVATSVLPPRSVCRWTVDGLPVETVLAEGSTGLVVAAGAGVVVGVLVVGGTALAARRGRL